MLQSFCGLLILIWLPKVPFWMRIFYLSYCLLHENELDQAWALNSDVLSAHLCESWEDSELDLNLRLRPSANNAL